MGMKRRGSAVKYAENGITRRRVKKDNGKRTYVGLATFAKSRADQVDFQDKRLGAPPQAPRTALGRGTRERKMNDTTLQKQCKFQKNNFAWERGTGKSPLHQGAKDRKRGLNHRDLRPPPTREKLWRSPGLAVKKKQSQDAQMERGPMAERKKKKRDPNSRRSGLVILELRDRRKGGNHRGVKKKIKGGFPFRWPWEEGHMERGTPSGPRSGTLT